MNIDVIRAILLSLSLLGAGLWLVLVIDRITTPTPKGDVAEVTCYSGDVVIYKTYLPGRATFSNGVWTFTEIATGKRVTANGGCVVRYK